MDTLKSDEPMNDYKEEENQSDDDGDKVLMGTKNPSRMMMRQKPPGKEDGQKFETFLTDLICKAETSGQDYNFDPLKFNNGFSKPH